MTMESGLAADGMVISSRRQLTHLRAGDGEAAALEMNRRLRGLFILARLARASSTTAVNQVLA